MSVLLVQIFLLLLGAFLLGATLACLFRRAFASSQDDSAETRVAPASSTIAGVPPMPPAAPVSADSQRFERALAGASGNETLVAGAPVIEVQKAVPAPRTVIEPPVRAPLIVPQPVAPPVAAPAVAPAPAPAPAPIAKAPEPARASPPAPAPAPTPTPASEPAAAPAPAPAPAPARTEPATRVPSYTEIAAAAPTPPASSTGGESYTQVALAAAAAAAAAAQKSQVFSGPADDLTRIRSVDLVTQARLNQLGVRSFADVAAWTASDVTRFSQSLGISGRIDNENWIEQAQILAKGGSVELPRKRDADASQAARPSAAAHNALHRIIGIDPETEAVLTSNGVRHIADIAGWGTAEVQKIEGLLGQPGRVERENWIAQARYLTGAPATGAVSTATIESAASAPKAEIPVPPAAPVPAPPVSAAPARNDNLAALRSVRSEALRGDVPLPLSGEIDDLKRIRGVGVLIEKKLHALGITSYEQVANWTRADIDRVSDSLDFKGRIERENWVEQARILASGGQTEFSRRADRGEV